MSDTPEQLGQPHGPRMCRDVSAVRLGLALFSETVAEDVAEASRRLGAALGVVSSGEEVRDVLLDALVVGVSRRTIGEAAVFLERCRGVDPEMSLVAAAGRLTAADVVSLMRASASDVLILPMSASAVADRLRDAVRVTRGRRDEGERARRLARICRQLTDERREVADQVEQLSAEMIETYETLSEDVSVANVSASFSAAVSDELDVESLLRLTLEQILDRLGVMNAVVFLPNSSGDWAVGAYVNADMPAATVELMLDQLADSMPEAMANDGWLVQLKNAAESEALLGESAAEWLGDRSVLVLPCDYEINDRLERLAMMSVFRAEGFDDTQAELLRVIGEAFAIQMAKIVRVHNRTSPGSYWFGFDVGASSGAGGDEEEDGSDGSDWWKRAA